MTKDISTGNKIEAKTGIKAIITAGGTSSRFGSNKLLEKINDKTVIQTTIEKFLEHVDEIIIPTHYEVEKHILECFNTPKIKFALPGETRQRSVYNALEVAAPCEYVLIHDGARAFVSEEIILRAIRQVRVKNAVVVGVLAVDTIKICNKHKKIIETPLRENVFHAQTPQAFLYETIFDVHKKLDMADGLNFTDDASMLEHLGEDVYMIEGEYSNIKITTKNDLL